MKHLIISALLLTSLILSACGSNPQTFETAKIKASTFPVCPYSVVNEYESDVATITVRPMPEELSTYIWNEIQDRYNCVFPSSLTRAE